VAEELMRMIRYESFVCHVRVTMATSSRENIGDGKDYVCRSQIREEVIRWIRDAAKAGLGRVSRMACMAGFVAT